MDTIYKRDFWKKRALHGYSSDYVKAQIDEKQASFVKERQVLEGKREELHRQNQTLQKEIELLQDRVSNLVVTNEQDLLKRLGDAYFKAIEEQLNVEEGLAHQKEERESRLEELGVERDRLLSRFKEVMKQLHSTGRMEEE